LFAAIGVVAATLRSRSATASRESSALSAEEQARLRQMLDKSEQDT
jgi:hypothetical protein